MDNGTAVQEPQTFKLHEVKPIVFTVEFTPDDIRDFDPFDLAMQLEPLLATDRPTLTMQTDLVRGAMGKDDLTPAQCFHIADALRRFLEELAASKKP